MAKKGITPATGIPYGTPGSSTDPGTNPGPGILGTIGHDLFGSTNAAFAQVIQKEQAAADKPKAKAKTKAKATTSATQARALEEEIATGPYSKILQSVVQEYQPAQQAAQTAASGALTAPATQGAWAQALQSLSGTPSILGENPSAWLGQNLATAAATSAPLTQAMANYGQAEQAQQQPILQNLQNLGQGLEEAVATAPEDAWLNALASHITSNLSYGGTVPRAITGELPSAVAVALKESGGYGSAGTGPGVISVSQLTTKGQYAKVPKSTTGASTVGALTGTGSVPGASSAPGQ